MIKRYCDQCLKQITEANEVEQISSISGGRRLAASIGHLGVEVIISQNNTANRGDYCRYCILDALYKLDDRPKERLA